MNPFRQPTENEEDLEERVRLDGQAFLNRNYTCGNCNNSVATEGDWCASCLVQAGEWNRQFPNGPLKGER